MGEIVLPSFLVVRLPHFNKSSSCCFIILYNLIQYFNFSDFYQADDGGLDPGFDGIEEVAGIDKDTPVWHS